jgi:hypothetical protein
VPHGRPTHPTAFKIDSGHSFTSFGAPRSRPVLTDIGPPAIPAPECAMARDRARRRTQLCGRSAAQRGPSETPPPNIRRPERRSALNVNLSAPMHRGRTRVAARALFLIESTKDH